MRTLLTILLALNLSGCGDVYRYLKSGEVGWALKKELRDRNRKEVALAKLTKFEWDELFLFSPYYPTNEVCKRLTLSTIDCKSIITSESTDDGEMLMVFRLRRKVVHAEMHIRWHGDFTPVPEKPLTPQTAIFSVSADRDWLKLRPIGNALTKRSKGRGGAERVLFGRNVRPLQYLDSREMRNFIRPLVLRDPVNFNAIVKLQNKV